MTGVQTCALPIFQIGVARAQCGGAKTAVQLGVAFITYANPAGVKQSNNRRDSFLPTDTRLLQVPLHARPQLGQRTAEPSAPVELVRFLSGAEIGMIAILFTALQIGRGSGRERVGHYVWIVVVTVSFKTKNNDENDHILH